MPLAISDVVWPLLTAFLALVAITVSVVGNLQRGKESRDAARDKELERCREEKRAIEMAYDIESARYVRLLRQRDEDSR